ncbi:hypothetical protein [Amycolatopsis sp. NPDC051102]|uniref:hypothetical protein n=1 Tax=Amycolatopsis sp. NPDC051102 TaxID=3155163 RepID=UPI00344518CD
MAAVMRSTSNIARQTTPFGAGQRPFGKDRPILATLAMGWTGDVHLPAWACAVYLTTVSTRTLSLDGRHLNFGFEVLSRQEPDSQTEIVHRLDNILVACRRQAKTLAGHNLDPDLARLASFASDQRRLPGVDTVRQHWANRSVKGRGTARMLDTAHDLGQAQETDLIATCDRVALKSGSIAAPDGRASPADMARRALTRTLAIALIAARAAGRYDWTSPIDLDELVLSAAWDQFDELATAPPSVPAP